ncbi:MAG TPA: hypothetical protein VLC52_03775 [Anaerolineae bacterium]|nr:hypothetical protein [Anaerolineae bacterium]
MSPWMKAGLIGGAVVVVLNLLGLIPCVGLIACGLSLVVYAGVGVLAAYWMPPLRNAGTAAGQGALAAVVAGLIGGIVNTILITIQVAATDTATILQSVPAQTLEQLRQSGIDPASLMSPVWGLATGGLCCLGGLVFAAILGAIGAAIYAAVKPD